MSISSTNKTLPLKLCPLCSAAKHTGHFGTREREMAAYVVLFHTEWTFGTLARQMSEQPEYTICYQICCQIKKKMPLNRLNARQKYQLLKIFFSLQDYSLVYLIVDSGDTDRKYKSRREQAYIWTWTADVAVMAHIVTIHACILTVNFTLFIFYHPVISCTKKSCILAFISLVILFPPQCMEYLYVFCNFHKVLSAQPYHKLPPAATLLHQIEKTQNRENKTTKF